MLKVKELKEFISDLPDNMEIRITSEFHGVDGAYFHHECEDILTEDNKYLVLNPNCIMVD